MSFWQDLEEMQKEIENLDTQSGSKVNSNDFKREKTNSKARIQELEEKAKSLSRMIANRSTLSSPRVQKNVDLCVQDATKSHDANVQLMHHLAALEDEIQNLTKKEDVWHDTAKIIQSEVKSLRNQINKMKSEQRTQSISMSRDRKRSGRSNRYVRSGRSRDNNNKYRDDRTERVETIERREYRTTDRERVEPRYEPTQETYQYRTETYTEQQQTAPQPQPLPVVYDNNNTTTRTEKRTVITENRSPQTRQRVVVNERNEVNIYKFQRLQRVNQQLLRDNENLKQSLNKNSSRFASEKQQLNLRITEKDTQVQNLKHELQNKEYALRDEQARINDLQQQIVVLQQVVEDYDNLKDSDAKLQLEYQRSLQDVLEARKEKSVIDQQLNAAKNQIQELEINCRQLNHEKMGALSEMRAMKQVFEQERKNVSDRYERIVQKLEAELSYAKKMYQEIKRKYRELQHKFEMDQPQYSKLKEQLESERDAFQSKLNDVVITHVSNLDMISKQSNMAMENSKWVQNVDSNENDMNDINNIHNMNNMQNIRGGPQIITTDMNSPSQGRKMSQIWEPSNQMNGNL